MAEHFTIYKDRKDVPLLCCAVMPPAHPFSGQIGDFPVCGELTMYLVTMKPYPNSLEETLSPVTGVCERHIVDLRNRVQPMIERIEPYVIPTTDPHPSGTAGFGVRMPYARLFPQNNLSKGENDG